MVRGFVGSRSSEVLDKLSYVENFWGNISRPQTAQMANSRSIQNGWGRGGGGIWSIIRDMASMKPAVSFPGSKTMPGCFFFFF